MGKIVAFDCKGTLFQGGKVLALYKWFESRGCRMIIWSSVYSYAEQAKQMHNLDGECWGKTYFSYDPDEQKHFVGISVDDDGWLNKSENRPLLGTHHLIDVVDIPDDESKFDELYGSLL